MMRLAQSLWHKIIYTHNRNRRDNRIHDHYADIEEIRYKNLHSINNQISNLYKNQSPPYTLEYIASIALAINCIEKRYCEWHGINSEIQRTERVFAYELYHWLKVIINDSTTRVDGEIDKGMFRDLDAIGAVSSFKEYLAEDKKELIKKLKFNKKKFTPDMVIHRRQNYMEEESQKSIIEIKTKAVSDIEILKTIWKLLYYMDKFNFQYVVFVSVNSLFGEVVEQLRKLFNKTDKVKLDRIIIMNYHFPQYNTFHFHAQTLRNILKGNDRLVEKIGNIN